MNPLSPFTYFRRHKRQTLLLVGLVSLMTLGICVMVRLLDSVPENYEVAGNYLINFNLVTAKGPSLDPNTVSQIRSHPDVAHVISDKGLHITLPPIISEHHIFGVSELDMQILMDASDLRIKEGRLPRANTNEMALSEEMANGMGIKIGDSIDRTIGRDFSGESWYDGIPVPLELVGILDGEKSNQDIRLGLVSYEFVNTHELFGPPWNSSLIIIPQDGHQLEVSQFLQTEISSPSAIVSTYDLLEKKAAGLSFFLYTIFGVIDVIVAVVIALVVGVINQISQGTRLGEFGVLNALGLSKSKLLRRSTGEAVGTTFMGWLAGLILAWIFFAVLKSGFYEPKGMVLSLKDLTPIWFSLPIPIVTAVVVAFNTRRTFSRLDAVSIIERGQLSTEAGLQMKVVNRSMNKPLSSWTFYQRHRRRGLILIITMGLMILTVSFPAFLFAPMGDAMQAFAEPLRQIGVVTPRMGIFVDPGVTAQVRSHPSVDRAIPAVALGLDVSVPPLGWPINVYGVSERDLQDIMDIYEMQIEEGHLPTPNTNEVVLTTAVALNRGLSVGDKFGSPIDEKDKDIPTEMVVTGILTLPDSEDGTGDLWWGFASLEYLTSHERYASHPMHLLVVPKEEQKANLDTWLRDDVNPELVENLTFDWMRSNYKLLALLLLGVFGIVELIVALVAALSLAVLSYVFFSQRLNEFGILHALGRSRKWLVMRTVKETSSTIIIAWLGSALICGIGLILVQINLYEPRGLNLNFLNPVPWLFTLPIPLAVIAASSGMVARMLRKLDPVSIIERR